MSKYPWIPQEYYSAVMFACKMIRENGMFNRAIETSANYYNVDGDELEKHVRARQAAGQRGKQRGEMKWFAVVGMYGNDANGADEYECKIVRGKSYETVSRRFLIEDARFNAANDYGGSYAPFQEHHVYGPYDTRDEAQKAANP